MQNNNTQYTHISSTAKATSLTVEMEVYSLSKVKWKPRADSQVSGR